jgi:hypothetical protein
MLRVGAGFESSSNSPNYFSSASHAIEKSSHRQIIAATQKRFASSIRFVVTRYLLQTKLRFDQFSNKLELNSTATSLTHFADSFVISPILFPTAYRFPFSAALAASAMLAPFFWSSVPALTSDPVGD